MDAVLVATRWWSSTHAMKPRIISLVSAIEDAELPRPNCGIQHPLLGTDLLKNKLLVSAL